MIVMGVQILVPLLINLHEWFGEDDFKKSLVGKVSLMLEVLDQTISTY